MLVICLGRFVEAIINSLRHTTKRINVLNKLFHQYLIAKRQQQNHSCIHRKSCRQQQNPVSSVTENLQQVGFNSQLQGQVVPPVSKPTLPIPAAQPQEFEAPPAAEVQPAEVV